MSVDAKQVMEALGKVNDPELHKDLVSLNMIKDVRVEGTKVSFTIELTTPACPMKNTIREDAEKAVKALDGVEEVAIEFSSNVKSSGQQGRDENLIPGVKNTVLVGSGKGGVGKSTVALNLALSLKRKGARVGLMDADVYGPSVPTMVGAKKVRPTANPETEKMRPIEVYGLKVMSVGFLMDEGQPVIWRGPLLTSLITQFLGDVEWGDLDYLIVDLPPGTGDVQLTFAQKISATGAILVTTPQDVALADVYRAKGMFDKVGIPTLGIIENMSMFECPNCNTVHEIFPGSGAEKASKDLEIPLLGKLPLVQAISEGSDTGRPALETDPDSAYAKVIVEAAQKMAGEISKRAFQN